MGLITLCMEIKRSMTLMTKTAKQCRDKRLGKNNSLNDLRNDMKCSNICIIGVSTMRGSQQTS